MGTRKIGPAIAAGCTMVVKPASQTPLTMLALGQDPADAGLPDGVLNILTSSSSSELVVKPLIDDSRLRKLSFTGSTEVGRQLMEQSSADCCGCRWSSAATRRSSCSTTPTSTSPWSGAMIAKMRNIGESCTAANRFHVAGVGRRASSPPSSPRRWAR